MRYVAALLMLAGLARSQQATRIYVESFGSQAGDSLREEMVRQLKGQKGVAIASHPADADRVLSGINQTFVRGYLSRNPRVRYRNSDSRPVYGGYVSVELKDRQDETIWSYLVTPRRFGSDDINRNVAEQIAAKLIQFLSQPQRNP